MGTLDVVTDGEARRCGNCGTDLTLAGAVEGRYVTNATGRFRADGAGVAFEEAAGTPVLDGQLRPSFHCRACGGLLMPSTTVQVERS